MTKIEAATKKLEDTIAHYQQEAVLRDMVIAGVKAVAHHQKVSKRLEKKLEEMFPQYTFSLNVPDGLYSSITLRVWGNGIGYDKGLMVFVSQSKAAEKGYAAFLEELTEGGRYNFEAWIDKAREQIAALPQLDAIAAKVTVLRAEADKLAREIDPVFGASGDVSSVYPELFK